MMAMEMFPAQQARDRRHEVHECFSVEHVYGRDLHGLGRIDNAILTSTYDTNDM